MDQEAKSKRRARVGRAVIKASADKISPDVKLLVFLFRTLQGDKEYAFPSLDSLAEFFGSRSRASKAKADLKNADIIKEVTTLQRAGKGRRQVGS